MRTEGDTKFRRFRGGKVCMQLAEFGHRRERLAAATNHLERALKMREADADRSSGYTSRAMVGTSGGR